MRLEKVALRLIAIVLIAGSLAGCATSSTFKPMDTASNTSEQSAPKGITPSFASEKQAAPGNVTGSVSQVRDPQAAQAADALASMSNPVTPAYRIGPRDVLDISVYQVPDLSKTVSVADTGIINLPLVGETPAAGKTAEELQRDLTSRLGAKYLQNPQVTVLVKEYNSARVTISGAITKPGVYPYKGESLMQFVAMAGGFKGEANWVVLVLRQSNGQRLAAKFDVSAIEKGRAQDPAIQAGDVIVADSSLAKRGLATILKVLPLASFAAL
jgi:polysaccharide export outer membrane protein